MIARYSTPEMTKLWSEETKFDTWLDVEVYACEAWADEGVVPREAVAEIRDKARIDVARIDEIEAATHHDVVAFTRQIAETIGEASKWVHYGLTSNDVVDTAQNIRLVKATDLILERLRATVEITKRMALEYKTLPCVGRTHGVHAEPTTFGLKCLLWHEEMKRNLERLERARETIRVGKISGAVGTFSQITPAIEEAICERAGLAACPVSTQVVQRDRHCEYMSALAILGATIEKIAVEIRHLQRTEVLEAEEPFGKGQKGSSAMPHKRNPVKCENLTGLARLLRSNLQAELENVALWHERDISHSSVERVILPDSTTLAHYMLGRLNGVLDGLVVHPENMLRNLNLTRGLVYSQHVLLALIDKGLLRETAYDIVQRCAMKTWEGPDTLKDNILADPDAAAHITADELDEIMRVERYFTHVDTIFRRCGVE